MKNQNSEMTISPVCFDKILKMAEEFCPDIAFGMVLQVHMGLRVTEICSLNIEDSSSGGSVAFYEGNGTVMRIFQIPDEHIRQLKSAYKKHKAFVEAKCIDSRYPLFINAHGTALSPDGYIRRVQSLNTLLTRSNDPDVKRFTEALDAVGKRYTCDVLRRSRVLSVERGAIVDG